MDGFDGNLFDALLAYFYVWGVLLALAWIVLRYVLGTIWEMLRNEGAKDRQQR